MSNDEDVRRAQAGRRAWNKWAFEHLRNGTAPDVDFSGAGLTTITFEGFVFPARANFTKTAFRQDVSFRKARFRQEACFTRAKFQGNAFFSNAKFFGRACLDRIEFCKD